MSAINIWLQPDSVTVITDGAHISPRGDLVGIASKVARLPHLNAVIATRSARPLLDMMAVSLGGYGTFDELAADFGRIVPMLANLSGSIVTDHGFEAVLAGWSEKDDELQVWGGIRPAKGDFTCQRLAGYRAPMNDAIGPVASVPLSNALELIEAQRAEAFAPYGGKAFHIVGGFVEETTVDRFGIRSRVLKRWPDQIGQPISTGPATPNFLAAAVADAMRAA